jgi:hypothetical protein
MTKKDFSLPTDDRTGGRGYEDRGLVGDSIVYRLTPDIAASTYADGKVIVPVTALSPTAFRRKESPAYIMNINAIDIEGVGPEMIVLFFDEPVDIGVQGANVAITATDAQAYLTSIYISSDDWKSVDASGDIKVLNIRGALGLGVANNLKRDMYYAIISKDANVYSYANQLVLQFTLSRDVTSDT